MINIPTLSDFIKIAESIDTNVDIPKAPSQSWDGFDIGGGLSDTGFVSRRHEYAKQNRQTVGEVVKYLKTKAGGQHIMANAKDIIDVLKAHGGGVEWHHGGKLPKSYGGGMAKTYFISDEQVEWLKKWFTIANSRLKGNTETHVASKKASTEPIHELPKSGLMYSVKGTPKQAKWADELLKKWALVLSKRPEITKEQWEKIVALLKKGVDATSVIDNRMELDKWILKQIQ